MHNQLVLYCSAVVASVFIEKILSGNDSEKEQKKVQQN